jgi:hypothetical protein
MRAAFARFDESPVAGRDAENLHGRFTLRQKH